MGTVSTLRRMRLRMHRLHTDGKLCLKRLEVSRRRCWFFAKISARKVSAAPRLYSNAVVASWTTLAAITIDALRSYHITDALWSVVLHNDSFTRCRVCLYVHIWHCRVRTQVWGGAQGCRWLDYWRWRLRLGLGLKCRLGPGLKWRLRLGPGLKRQSQLLGLKRRLGLGFSLTFKYCQNLWGLCFFRC